jgi:hypothetical protein
MSNSYILYFYNVFHILPCFDTFLNIQNRTTFYVLVLFSNIKSCFHFVLKEFLQYNRQSFAKNLKNLELILHRMLINIEPFLYLIASDVIKSYIRYYNF